MTRASFYKVLIVEDDLSINQLLQNSIIDAYENIRVYTANSLKEAYELFSEVDFDIIILDYMLTNGKSNDFIRHVKGKKRILPIIVITGWGSIEVKMELLEAGATIFVEKPFDMREILILISNLIQLNETYRGLEHAQNVIDALVKAIEQRDTYTEGHAERVAEYAVKIFDNAGLRGEQRQDLYTGCLLHDIGKMGIPDYILKSDQPLKRDSSEFELIKAHPRAGFDICKDIHLLKPSLPVILQHHEKLDGSGYPQGLRSEDINILAQISAIADIYDALTSKRMYRDSNSPKDAIQIMEEEVENNKLNKFFFLIFKRIVEKEEALKKNENYSAS